MDKTLSVLDVASYIVDELPLMTTMKLQKLTYYSFVEYADKTKTSLFLEEIQAWVNGPIIPELFSVHRGNFFAQPDLFKKPDLSKFSKAQRDAIDKTLKEYGNWSGGALSEKTHSESPWINARDGYGERDRCCEVISLESILDWLNCNAKTR